MKVLYITVCCVGIGFLLSCISLKQSSSEQTVSNKSDLEQLYSEENYSKFGRLFEQTESEMQNLVVTLKESDVFDSEDDCFVIYFTDRNELERIHYYPSSPDRKQIVVCEGEILEDRSTDSLVESINGNDKLNSAIKGIGETGVIKLINAEKESNRIDFGVDTKHTPFITGNNGLPNYFVYTEEKRDFEKYGYSKMKDNWYMRITPPPE